MRLPKEFDESVDIFRDRLIRKGVENVPTLKKYLNDKHCLFCRIEMKRIENAGSRLIYKCPKCGFSKPVINMEAPTTIDETLSVLGKGTIVGLSIYMLSGILEK